MNREFFKKYVEDMMGQDKDLKEYIEFIYIHHNKDFDTLEQFVEHASRVMHLRYVSLVERYIDKATLENMFLKIKEDKMQERRKRS